MIENETAKLEKPDSLRRNSWRYPSWARSCSSASDRAVGSGARALIGASSRYLRRWSARRNTLSMISMPWRPSADPGAAPETDRAAGSGPRHAVKALTERADRDRGLAGRDRPRARYLQYPGRVVLGQQRPPGP